MRVDAAKKLVDSLPPSAFVYTDPQPAQLKEGAGATDTATGVVTTGGSPTGQKGVLTGHAALGATLSTSKFLLCLKSTDGKQLFRIPVDAIVTDAEGRVRGRAPARGVDLKTRAEVLGAIGTCTASA